MTLTDYILQLIRVRTSCRYFDPDASISDVEIDTLLGAVAMGPSAGGLYAFAVHHTEDKETIKALAESSANQNHIADCASVFVICSVASKSVDKYGERGFLYAIQDATIAGMNLTFAATALWLGTCWIGSIDTEFVIEKMNLPEGELPLSLICVGKWRDENKKKRIDQQDTTEAGHTVLEVDSE